MIKKPLLAKIMGCHQEPSRSFFYKKRQFPVCARCTGELIGFLIFFPLLSVVEPTFLFSLVLLIPMGIDGLVQRYTEYESTNFLRLLTGSLGGIGLLMIIYAFGSFFAQLIV